MDKWKLTGTDIGYGQHRVNEMCQMAIKLATKKDLNKVLSNFKKMFMGLRMRTDGEYLYPNNLPIEVHQIPRCMNDCRSVTEFMYNELSPDWNEVMASIAVGDDIIAVSSNHICSDGGFLLHAFNHCLDDDVGPIPKFPCYIPDAYKDHFDKLDIKDRAKLLDKEELVNFPLDQSMKTADKFKPAQYFTRVFPTSTASCYDHKTKKCNGLNDVLSCASVLTIMATTQTTDRFGLYNNIDLRKYLKNGGDLSCCNHFIGVRIKPHGITLNSTVQEMKDGYRKMLQWHLKEGGVFHSYFQPFETPFPKAIVCGTSNLGPIKAKYPIEDFWLQSNMASSHAAGCFFVLTYSRIIGDLNEIVIKYTFDQDTIPRETARKVADSIVYATQHIAPNTRIIDAIQQIGRYQRNEWK